MKRIITLLQIILVAGIVGCATPEERVDTPLAPPAEPSPAPATPDPSPTVALPAAAPETPLPERVPALTATAGTGELPETLLRAIMADLSRRSGTSAGNMTVVRAEQAIWSDGSLGCPEPGVEYTQAPVTGYWVVLNVDGWEYDYRVDDQERFSLCENPGLPGREPPSG